MNGCVHFSVAALEAVAKAGHRNLILHVHPKAKPSLMGTGQCKLMVWATSPFS